MLALSSLQDFLNAVSRAKNVVFEAYILQPRGRVFTALENACKRGAQVQVRIAEDTYANPNGSHENADAVGVLQRFGADAKVVSNIHCKAAVVDGVGYLDDCNWKQDTNDTILRDDSPADLRMIQDAANGDLNPSTDSFAITKDTVLAQERKLLESAAPGQDIIVETESLSYCDVAWELGHLALKQHCHVHLIVNKDDVEKQTSRYERDTLNWLETCGVDVRFSAATEKFAVVGKNAWIGSANISTENWRYNGKHPGQPDTIEWGTLSNDTHIVAHLNEVFRQRWEHVSYNNE